MGNFRYFLFLCLFLFFGCESDQIEGEQMEVSKVIKHLNQENYQAAYEVAEEGLRQDPNSEEMLYWKAQSLAGLAKVDVYTLFPIIKMKVFEFAITDWQQYEDFSDKRDEYNEVAVMGEDINDEDTKFLQEKLIELQIKNPDEFEFEVIESLKYHRYGNCEFQLIVDSPDFVVELKDYDKLYAYFNKECDRVDQDDWDEKHFQLQRDVQYLATSSIRGALNDKEEREIQSRFYKFFLALYDSLPILRQLPNSTPNSAEHIVKALETYEEYLEIATDDSPRAQTAFKHMGLLASFLIIGPLVTHTDFTKVTTPMEILCHADEVAFLNEYDNMYLGLKYLLIAAEHGEFANANIESIVKLKDQFKEVPETLDENDYQRNLESIQEQKEDICEPVPSIRRN